MLNHRFDAGGTPGWRTQQASRRDPLRWLAGPRRWDKWSEAQRTVFAILLPFYAFAGIALGIVAAVVLASAIGLL